jgi:hypothetical protein
MIGTVPPARSTTVRRGRAAVACCAVVALGALLCVPAAGAKETVWLCRPGMTADPCRSSLDATVETATGAKRVERAKLPKAPKVDCFYVYPTVVGGDRMNASVTVTPILRAVATLQASRFSQVCRVFAPVYPQLTTTGLLRFGDAQRRAVDKAYRGVRNAWKDYLRSDNDGRGVILIGHSQGSGILERLVREEIDGDARVRARLVSALLMGGDVTVAKGKDVGGDFRRIPACRTAAQTGCVVAYSSFTETPPPNSLFGKVPSAFRTIFGGPNTGALEVLCANPSQLVGAKGAVTPYFADPTAADGTPWITYPGLYRSACRSAGGTNRLQIDDVGGPDDPRPVIAPTSGPIWGTHNQDVNVELGDLVTLAGRQAAAYTRR